MQMPPVIPDTGYSPITKPGLPEFLNKYCHNNRTTANQQPTSAPASPNHIQPQQSLHGYVPPSSPKQISAPSSPRQTILSPGYVHPSSPKPAMVPPSPSYIPPPSPKQAIVPPSPRQTIVPPSPRQTIMPTSQGYIPPPSPKQAMVPPSPRQTVIPTTPKQFVPASPRYIPPPSPNCVTPTSSRPTTPRGQFTPARSPGYIQPPQSPQSPRLNIISQSPTPKVPARSPYRPIMGLITPPIGRRSNQDFGQSPNRSPSQSPSQSSGQSPFYSPGYGPFSSPRYMISPPATPSFDPEFDPWMPAKEKKQIPIVLGVTPLGNIARVPTVVQHQPTSRYTGLDNPEPVPTNEPDPILTASIYLDLRNRNDVDYHYVSDHMRTLSSGIKGLQSQFHTEWKPIPPCSGRVTQAIFDQMLNIYENNQVYYQDRLEDRGLSVDLVQKGLTDLETWFMCIIEPKQLDDIEGWKNRELDKLAKRRSGYCDPDLYQYISVMSEDTLHYIRYQQLGIF